MEATKVLIYGNCQTDHVKKILSSHPSFNKHFQILPTKPVHTQEEKDLPALYEAVRNADVVIYQPVPDVWGIFSTSHILEEVRADAKVLTMCIIYFLGYHPQTVYLRAPGSHRAVTGGPCDYHDLFIMRSFKDGLSVEQVITRINEGALGPELMARNYEDTMAIMRKREKNLNIKVADFIEANWQKKRLFYTINHCTDPVYLHIVGQILEILGMDNASGSTGKNPSASVLLPIYPEVYNHFGFGFPRETYILNKSPIGWLDYVSAFYKYYSRNQELLDYNLELYKNRDDYTRSRIAGMRIA